jgi:hypothetical protein
MAMWKDLSDVPPEPHADGLDIRVVATPAQLADYAAILAADRDPPSATVRRFFAGATGWALSANCRAHYLVGHVGDRPVCSAEVLNRYSSIQSAALTQGSKSPPG